MHLLPAVVVILAAAAGLAACSGTTTTAETATVGVTDEAEPTPGPTQEASETAAVETTSAGEAAAAVTPSGPPVIVGGGVGEQRLTLADIFRAEGWDEGAMEIPNSTEPAQGAIFKNLDWNRDGAMELRFQRQRGTLTIEVAQALMSTHSDVPIEWKLSADGRLVETQTVLFNERRTMTLPLTGVSAVILEAKPAKGETSRSFSTTAVVVSLTITPE